MTIHIYGDSFAEEHDNEFCWPVHLGTLRNETMVDYAMGGSGPNFSLELLINHLENSIHKPMDTVIILLSDQKRLHFPWLKNLSHTSGMFRIAEDDPNYVHPYYDGQEYLYEYKDIANDIAKTLGPMMLYENVKNIMFLYLLSKNYKHIKFIVATCFSLNHYISLYKSFNITSTKLLDELDFYMLDTPNFEYIKIPIGHIVGEYDKKNDGELMENMRNHMTRKQNILFAEFINDLMNGEKEIDTSWFSSNPYDDPHEIDRKREKLFIYD